MENWKLIFSIYFFFVPGLTRRKNYKVYKLTNQYPQRGGTKAVFGTCPSCCLTLISLRESSERTIWALHICSYIRRQSDNPASLLLCHGDFVINFFKGWGRHLKSTRVMDLTLTAYYTVKIWTALTPLSKPPKNIL